MSAALEEARRRAEQAYRLNYAMAHGTLCAVQLRGHRRVLGRVDYQEARPKSRLGPAYRVGGRWVDLADIVEVESRREPRR